MASVDVHPQEGGISWEEFSEEADAPLVFKEQGLHLRRKEEKGDDM